MRASRLIKTSLYIEMLVVAVLVCFFVALQINKSVKRYQENEVSQKLDLISHQLNQFMDTHFIVLQEIASKPLLVQSIMQPEENMGTLTEADFTHGICPECAEKYYSECFNKERVE